MANPMEIYGRIKELGKNAKVEADAFMQGLAKKYTKENSQHWYEDGAALGKTRKGK